MIFLNMLWSLWQDTSSEINEHHYPRYYLLIDGIYLQWPCFVQLIQEPWSEIYEHFAKCQEDSSKDVEMAFEVLKARWKIIKNLVLQEDLDIITSIIMACIIMHNMIAEDKQG